MNIQEVINEMYKIRIMSTQEQCDTFRNYIELIQYEKINIDMIEHLMNVLDDDNMCDSLMYEVILIINNIVYENNAGINVVLNNVRNNIMKSNKLIHELFNEILLDNSKIEYIREWFLNAGILDKLSVINVLLNLAYDKKFPNKEAEILFKEVVKLI